MRYLGYTFVALAFFCAAAVHAEEIQNFSSDFQIKKDGTVLTTETIVYDFGSEERHGIFRTLLNEHPQPSTAWYKDRYIDIDVLEVLQDGVTATYEESQTGTEVELKIGDADTTISGVHTYTITYLLRGALSYGPEGTEFYYDVTGTGWGVLIKRATALVKVEEPQMLIDRAACYEGSYGSEERCGDIATSTDAIAFSSVNLGPYEGLTIAQALNPAAVEVHIIERTMSWLLFVSMLLGFIVVASVYVFRFRNRFNPHASTIAEYEPYPDVLPMYTGVLVDGQLDPKDITAGLVYLAEQGFLKIKKTERKVMFFFEVDDYELTLKKSISEVPTSFLKTVVELLFTTGEAGEMVALSSIKKDQSKQRANLLKLQKLREALAKDLKQRGFYEGLPSKGYMYISGGALLVTVIAWLAFDVDVASGFTVITAFILIMLLVIGHRRRTEKGFTALNHLKGFKDFLSVTDAERYKFHNAPSKSPEQFMSFLPYAIALGVEKEWAEVFKDITIPTPDWYDGGSVGAFSATSLSHDIGAFSTSFASSSGSSGSSGGGSSGGGGGGGGGGSW